MEGFTKEDADAVEKIINAKWQERLSGGGMSSDISAFVHGLKQELVTEIRALVGVAPVAKEPERRPFSAAASNEAVEEKK